MSGYFLAREPARHPDGSEHPRPLLIRVTPLGVSLLGPQDVGGHLLQLYPDGVVPSGEALFCTGTPPDVQLYRVARLDPGEPPPVGIIRAGRVYAESGEVLAKFTYAPIR
jgi:hypothetical protein